MIVLQRGSGMRRDHDSIKEWTTYTKPSFFAGSESDWRSSLEQLSSLVMQYQSADRCFMFTPQS